MNTNPKHKRPTLHWGLSALLVLSFILAACAPAETATSAPTEPPSVATEAASPTPTEEPQPLPPITILINESPWLAGFEALVNILRCTNLY